MKLITHLTLLIFSILFSSTIFAEESPLWRGTTYGMSPAQVKAVIPEVKTPDTNQNILGSGATELLRIDNYELVSNKFTVRFYFLHERLQQVTLQLNDSAIPFSTAMLVVNEISSSLRIKYGQEISKKVKDYSYDIRWQIERTNIDLLLWNTSGLTILNLNYQTRSAQEADKL